MGRNNCSLTEGIEVTKETSVSFGISGAFDVSKAVDSGLDFGVGVSYSTTKSQSTGESFPVPRRPTISHASVDFNTRFTGKKLGARCMPARLVERNFRILSMSPRVF